MQFPALMPKELLYLEASSSEEALEELLTKKPFDLVFFFETASDDETWSANHEPFMCKLAEWLTAQAYHDRLEYSLVKRIAAAIKKHQAVLGPLVPRNIDIQLKDGAVSVNGLLLAATSDFFKQVLLKECREKDSHALSLSIETAAFAPIESFISIGVVADLPVRGQEEIITLLRQAAAWEIGDLAQACEKMLAKYLTPENAVAMLYQAKQERWFEFQKLCAEFINRTNRGFLLSVPSLDRLAFEFLDFQEETLQFFNSVRSLVTDLVCKGDLTENPHFGAILKQCPGLLALDISETSSFSDQLTEVAKELQFLNLSECSWTSRDTFKTLQEICPSIKQMTLCNNAHLNFSAWGELAKFKQLKKLDLTQCHQISDSDLSIILRGCSNLNELSLAYCLKIGVRGFLDLAKTLPRLTHLDLTRCAISDEALVEIASRCRVLMFLNISACDRLTEKGVLAAVKNASSLQTLNISRCRFPEVAVETIKRMSPYLDLRQDK